MKYMASIVTTEENQNYPDESFDEFIAQMIKRKQEKIISVLDVHLF